ncbi:unnamed protein product [Symbiodinium necroappetens]|uniref:Uncharacterized protein n=1 Tax=Symbiodinium necroappetens TaxID=1628268 RepID=A0A813BN27_9DINO|nr:unnamed protein product [Symbiodinium necroappetens]
MEGIGKGSGGKNKVGTGETELDSPQRLGLVPADVRGRGRQRETSSRQTKNNDAAALQYLATATDAAHALSAALGPPLEPRIAANGTIPDQGSLDSVRNLPRHESPEKKARTSKMPAAPCFGSGSAPSAYPPLFHGVQASALPGPATPGVPHPVVALPPARTEPEHFDLDEPGWLGGLKQQLQELVQTQHNMATQLRSLQDIQTEIRTLSHGQSDLNRRADEHEFSLKQMHGELKELERELTALKSAPPTRSVSPAPSVRGTPRSEMLSDREVDELQIVIGGWNECRREDIESEVRNIFHAMNADALVKQVYVPYVRCGYCRVELLYPEPNIWAQRKLQGIVVQAIKDLQYVSTISGQQHCKFWAARNRSLQERAKVRAILSTQELCIKHVGPAIVDKDWRGKVWVSNTQVLHHVDTKVINMVPLEIAGLTWNLHGKGIQHVSTLMQGLEAPPDIFFLQEKGDVRGVAEGASRQDTSFVAGREYQVFLANPHYSHRCCAVLIALDLEFMNPHVHVHEFGVFVKGRMNACAWCFASLHFPHQQRSDAPDTWEKGISTLLGWLTGESWDTNILIGHDLNQDLHAEFDEFAGMLHYREFVFQMGLQTSPPLGDTWIARGSSSAIDFYLHQIRGAELRFVKREDLRISLPSDHNAIQVHCSFRGKRLWEELMEQDVWDNDCINQAFREPQEIHQLRIDAKVAHKENLLQEAQAAEMLFSFYADKYSVLMKRVHRTAPDHSGAAYIAKIDIKAAFDSLSRTSNAYYGFKKLMDSGRAPVSTRLLIFSTFITAKWAWAVWLTRIWSYLGHLDRISPSDVRPSWVADLLIRRVQRIYDHWDWASEWPSWELMAKDRTQWNSHARTWVRHWTMSDTEGVATFEYLYDRQLILLKGKKTLLDCLFRPAKDFTDTPYTTPLCVIKPAKLGGPVLWAKARDQKGRYPEVHQVAQALLQDHQGPVTFGAYVRVKSGIRSQTYQYPETFKLFTAFLADEFAGDAFLTIQIQRDVEKAPHKDHRNSSHPTLILNLSQGAPGGTWVESPQGTMAMRCADGAMRMGHVLTGHRYRISASRLWHATVPSTEERILLLGWVPAGWHNLEDTARATLACLGFVKPPNLEGPPTSLTLWRGSAEVQRRLEDFGIVRQPCLQWKHGVLRQERHVVHICLSSDDESPTGEDEDSEDVVCMTA